MRQLQTWLADVTVNLVGIQGLGNSALAAYLYQGDPPLPPLKRGGNLDSSLPSLKSEGNLDPFLPRLQTEENLKPPFLRGVGGISNADTNQQTGFKAKFWADVSQKPDFSFFAEQIITAFGGQITKQGDVTLLINDLLNCLNRQRCLLVIDNLETLLDSDRQWLNAAYQQFFSRWVQQGGTSALLVTTQEKPVMFQPQGCWYALAGMKIIEGAALLQQLGIQGTVTELEAFAREVDGHPLTLRLAAGYLREYCHSQLNRAQELGLENFEQLVAEAEGLHRDKQDVRLSWILQQHFERLTLIQKDFLCNLSVYRQPFDYQAAAGMLASDEEVTAMTIQQLLRELFNRSLLLETQDKFQYQLLVRQYVQQQATDLRVAHQKAIDYYLLNLKQRPWQTIDDITEYLETFYHHCELKQYAQAFDAIYNSSNNDDCNNFLNLGGYNAIRIQLYSQLIQAWQPSNPDETWQFTASLTSLGNAYYSLEDYQQAIDYHQQSLVIKREIGDRSGQANSWFNLGNALNKLNREQDAMGAYRNSRQLS